MNDTLKSIVRVLDEGTPELKVAASQILGELAPQDIAVVEALEGHLSLGDNTLNRYILQALAQIGSGPAIRALVGRLRDGGSTADLVRHLLSSIGGDVCEALASTFAEEDSALQAQMVQILGHYSAPEAIQALVSASLGADEELSRTARNLVLDRLPEVPQDEQKAHREAIYKILKSNQELAPFSLANGLRIVAAINVTQSRPTLLKYAHPEYPPVVRRAALFGLEQASLTSAQADGVLSYLEDADVVNVVKPALVALRGHTDWSKTGITTLRGLLSSRREEMKLFALEALQDVQTEEVAKIYMAQMHSAKADVQAAAVQALGKNPKALAGLLKSFSTERNATKASTLLQALIPHKERIKPAQIKTMAEKCGKQLADASPLGEVILDLLLAAGPELATECLVDKAMRLRRARKLTESLRILIQLAKAQVLDIEGRYQLALARLIKDNDEGRAGIISQTGDATMGFIAGLVRDSFPVLERLKKESMLHPEDLLRVGRHFSGGIGPEQKFGAEMLEYVAKKHAKAKAGEEALMMIRSEGLA